jgi:hypothetical protein
MQLMAQWRESGNGSRHIGAHQYGHGEMAESIIE